MKCRSWIFVLAWIPVVLLADGETKAVYPGNEAVSASASGTRQVKTMKPGPEKYPSPPFYANAGQLAAARVGVTAFDSMATKLYMIEGPEQLMECSAITLDQSVCRPSTFGSVQRLRYWIVLKNNTWVICHRAGKINKYAKDGVVCSNDFPPPPARPPGSVIPDVMLSMGKGIKPE